MDAPNRLDPYWDGLWGAGSAASWLTADLAHRQADAGLGRLPGELDLPREQALASLDSPRGFDDRLAMLGAIFAWRNTTAEQMAALTGHRQFADALRASPARLFAAGVIDLGVFSNGLRFTDLDGRGAVYRPGSAKVFDRDIRPRLTWAERVAITGGQPWTIAGKTDRHNIIGTELGLRLAEYTDVGTVLGERFSSLQLLDRRSRDRKGSGPGSLSAADLCAVRSDGLRIAFEITANTGPHFDAKVDRWVRLLAENPFDTSGLCVVFVIIEHPERLGTDSDMHQRSRVYQRIAAATKEFPGLQRDRTAERIGVATWREWFPARGQVHAAAFTGLRVDRPTGVAEHLWEPCDMLDPDQRTFDPSDVDESKAVLHNAALLGGTPHWLRDAYEPPDMVELLLERSGANEIPHPTPVRPQRTKGLAPGAARGAAGAVKPPPRLFGLKRRTA